MYLNNKKRKKWPVWPFQTWLPTKIILSIIIVQFRRLQLCSKGKKNGLHVQEYLLIVGWVTKWKVASNQMHTCCWPNSEPWPPTQRGLCWHANVFHVSPGLHLLLNVGTSIIHICLFFFSLSNNRIYVCLFYPHPNIHFLFQWHL